MENHPLTFVVLILVGIGYAIYYTFKIIGLIFVAIYKWINKRIIRLDQKKEVNNNADR